MQMPTPDLIPMKNGHHLLKNVRLTYPSLHGKAVFDGKVERFYTAKLLIYKKFDATVEKVRSTLSNLWTRFIETNGGEMTLESICLYDGDVVKGDKKEFKDAWYINAKAQHQPVLVSETGEPVLPEDRSRLYSGCYVDTIVRFWIARNKRNPTTGEEYPPRINCYLQLVKHVAQGPRLGISYTFDLDEAEHLIGVSLEDVIGATNIKG